MLGPAILSFIVRLSFIHSEVNMYLCNNRRNLQSSTGNIHVYYVDLEI